MAELFLACEVCLQPAAGVCSSSLGAMSFAFCPACARAGREPYSALVATLPAEPAAWADWVRPTIAATLKFFNKTEKDLIEDIKKLEREYMREMAQPTAAA